jgi:acyl-CoA reductase-like NAD-dependent aldehyde dehydrogenase
VHEDDETKVVRRYTPIGVSVGIVPWNYPLSLALGKVGPATLAGNPMILKPSPFTPYCGLKLGEIAQKHFPPGVVQVLSGDDNLGPWLTSHRGPEKISFTGSTVVGKKIMESAAGTMKRLTLELGGNDATIVCKDVDVQQTAKKVCVVLPPRKSIGSVPQCFAITLTDCIRLPTFVFLTRARSALPLSACMSTRIFTRLFGTQW